jgi:methylglyoxal synthase
MNQTMLLGLAANRLHHQTEDAALFDLLRACESGIRELNLGLHAVGRTYDAIAAADMMHRYPGLVRYPYGREGGLMKLVAEVVGMGEGRTLDGAIYLTDPVDPSSIFPEALALKRQCVIHGLGRDRHADRFHDYASHTLALIAHDAMKPDMLDFAAHNFELLSRFKRRVGTGTTGQKLNEMAWSKGWPADKPWVDRYNSGPLGGDAQIADLVLERRCQRAIFFEDPHVARQHEADIQLLERAVTTVTHEAVCITTPKVAQRWCDAAVMRAKG